MTALLNLEWGGKTQTNRCSLHSSATFFLFHLCSHSWKFVRLAKLVYICKISSVQIFRRIILWALWQSADYPSRIIVLEVNFHFYQSIFLSAVNLSSTEIQLKSSLCFRKLFFLIWKGSYPKNFFHRKRFSSSFLCYLFMCPITRNRKISRINGKKNVCIPTLCSFPDVLWKYIADILFAWDFRTQNENAYFCSLLA